MDLPEDNLKIRKMSEATKTELASQKFCALRQFILYCFFTATVAIIIVIVILLLTNISDRVLSGGGHPFTYILCLRRYAY